MNRNVESKNSSANDNLFNNVIRQLSAIAETYQAIAVQRGAIQQRHQRLFAQLDVIKAKIQEQINRLEQEKQSYLGLLNETQKQLADDIDALERQKLQFSIDGYKSITQSMQVQQQIWQNFAQAQVNLTQKLAEHSRQIDVLLYILEINAKIYQQAANAAALRRSAMIELNSMIDLNELRRVIKTIGENEKAIESLTQRIEQTHVQ